MNPCFTTMLWKEQLLASFRFYYSSSRHHTASRSEGITIMPLIRLSQLTKDAKDLFLCLSPTCMFALEKWLLNSIVHFQTGFSFCYWTLVVYLFQFFYLDLIFIQYILVKFTPPSASPRSSLPPYPPSFKFSLSSLILFTHSYQHIICNIFPHSMGHLFISLRTPLHAQKFLTLTTFSYFYFSIMLRSDCHIESHKKLPYE